MNYPQTVVRATLFLAFLTFCSSAAAQAVQLPTHSYFGVGTTVSVPVGGSTYLGGVNRASSGITEYGTPLLPFRNRSMGYNRSASSVRVSAYVHDFAEMERNLANNQIAASPYARPYYSNYANVAGAYLPPPAETDSRWLQTAQQESQQETQQESQQVNGPTIPNAKVWSVSQDVSGLNAELAAARAERIAAEQEQQKNALKNIEWGRKAEALGNIPLAKKYYTAAFRLADAALKKRIYDYCIKFRE